MVPGVLFHAVLIRAEKVDLKSRRWLNGQLETQWYHILIWNWELCIFPFIIVFLSLRPTVKKRPQHVTLYFYKHSCLTSLCCADKNFLLLKVTVRTGSPGGQMLVVCRISTSHQTGSVSIDREHPVSNVMFPYESTCIPLKQNLWSLSSFWFCRIPFFFPPSPEGNAVNEDKDAPN